jgi:hypothetical protein
MNTNLTDALFSSPCSKEGLCQNLDCSTAVVEYEGRHYITFGHAGYNSPANNGDGYGSKAKALAAMKHYMHK